ncbi:hypothetical protein PAXRUDRAFT_15478 [Paxillus rubicundulus Ve08.2h10]|uniref:Uncharacterized protein n=1 Tax=Paxillus rubicundulus Ve08.2h10 TaxID=930991 RepID=A0A0D0CZD6_9AGAM|nr:hypothetical protein PAXRUDRAFT_15478 [Paxillus rubicundulus Ve08.2h10]
MSAPAPPPAQGVEDPIAKPKPEVSWKEEEEHAAEMRCWESAETIFLLAIGSVLLVLGVTNEIFTKRSAIIPPPLFKTRTTGMILISMFLHAVAFFSGTLIADWHNHLTCLSLASKGSYYLPIYYQVMFYLSRSESMSNVQAQCLYAGGTVGITIGKATISSAFQQRLKGIPGLTINTSAAALNDSLRQSHMCVWVEDPTLKAQVTHVYTRSISAVWLVNTPLSAVGLFLTLFIRGYSLKRVVICGDAAKPVDPRKGEFAAEVGESGIAETAEGEKAVEAPTQDDATDRTRTSLTGSMGKEEKVGT